MPAINLLKLSLIAITANSSLCQDLIPNASSFLNKDKDGLIFAIADFERHRKDYEVPAGKWQVGFLPYDRSTDQKIQAKLALARQGIKWSPESLPALVTLTNKGDSLSQILIKDRSRWKEVLEEASQTEEAKLKQNHLLGIARTLQGEARFKVLEEIIKLPVLPDTQIGNLYNSLESDDEQLKSKARALGAIFKDRLNILEHAQKHYDKNPQEFLGWVQTWLGYPSLSTEYKQRIALALQGILLNNGLYDADYNAQLTAYVKALDPDSTAAKSLDVFADMTCPKIKFNKINTKYQLARTKGMSARECVGFPPLVKGTQYWISSYTRFPAVLKDSDKLKVEIDGMLIFDGNRIVQEVPFRYVYDGKSASGKTTFILSCDVENPRVAIKISQPFPQWPAYLYLKWDTKETLSVPSPVQTGEITINRDGIPNFK